MKQGKWISKEAIIEIGLRRSMGVCGWCEKPMKRNDHHIQLCEECRIETLEKNAVHGYRDALEDKEVQEENNG